MTLASEVGPLTEVGSDANTVSILKVSVYEILIGIGEIVPANSVTENKRRKRRKREIESYPTFK